MTELWQAIEQLFVALGNALVALITGAGAWLLLVVWVAWWLWAVNWSKAWRTLAEGAWMPFLLLGVLCALVWSQVAPAPCDCLGFTSLPNFWWQLGAVGLLMCVALFCGWLQGVMLHPPLEVNVEPPAEAHGDHGHGHDHGHGGGHH